MSVIGLSGNLLYENTSIPKAFVNRSYVDSVIRSKGAPFIMPITEDEEIIKKMVENVDGIIMTGGVDVHPFRFDEEPIEKIGTISAERDEFDFTLMKYAVEMNKPIFGICRGIQVINVYFGGSLIQDIPSQRNTNILHSQTAEYHTATHKIQIVKDSIIYDMLDETSEVNSFHHQAIDKVAKDFKVTATAKDGIIEAIEYKKKGSFIIGVQWHPELMSSRIVKMQNIFDMFIEVCRSRK
ncbi:gamma-glutamyl-gamma-aminobutyrate hydrolase family protein [Brachyspira hyodysenteriae]|uniref:gamma-glutamyl-gamma-aminobutyrate hydrolase n=2 Tax=Brachyspira hyodysenteriae TaxID=159 RepID=A0A3B6VGQ3_BRAHW|nr:gamma-glutamyl-gamma-aminobutyrate hydrolase family protein [Brachyspira hyodysenteriae]ACN83588.1 predicted glutamine amidotransferase [Brachyspira hyodysenteriae WA1]ANN64288.1 gamma-glutamyl-gamma-aminobutyrate hydrolase [Brachyspira hyodysenteriae ATCC 27164]KLI26845.1 glutamine amidotransferase [Brachyspira hyodysenteriae]KLI27927.1 glutamine amidotransferase [Brachyspira hyodysenteriae]KLI35726.1 glutamine amidotransferase [Brachyspira hyodysenteriae]